MVPHARSLRRRKRETRSGSGGGSHAGCAGWPLVVGADPCVRLCPPGLRNPHLAGVVVGGRRGVVCPSKGGGHPSLKARDPETPARRARVGARNVKMEASSTMYRAPGLTSAA